MPLTITVQFIAIDLGWLQDPAAVKAMTRTGNPREILRGSLLYGLVFVVCALFFWRNSPVGIMVLIIMCGGDRLADIVGRRWGVRKLPFSSDKSWAGSAAMFGGSFTLGMLAWFEYLGLLVFSHSPTALIVAAISPFSGQNSAAH